MKKQELYNRLIIILNKYEVNRISIFGSYVTGLDSPKSDIDILVEFSDRKSLLELVSIENELTDELGINVDLLTEKSISPYLIDDIKREMVNIYP